MGLGVSEFNGSRQGNRAQDSALGGVQGSLVELDRDLASAMHEVIVCGSPLGAREILHVAQSGTPVRFTDDQVVLNRITVCYERMMRDVAEGVPVYGCNTGYGAQASKVLADGTEGA